MFHGLFQVFYSLQFLLFSKNLYDAVKAKNVSTLAYYTGKQLII